MKGWTNEVNYEASLIAEASMPSTIVSNHHDNGGWVADQDGEGSLIDEYFRWAEDSNSKKTSNHCDTGWMN